MTLDQIYVLAAPESELKQLGSRQKLTAEEAKRRGVYQPGPEGSLAARVRSQRKTERRREAIERKRARRREKQRREKQQNPGQQ